MDAMSDDDYLRPKPTPFKGVLMRSRLEAQWASVFDTLMWGRWTYEPPPWRPDFEVEFKPGDKVLVEVKNSDFDPKVDSLSRFVRIAEASGLPTILIVGNCWPGQYQVWIYSSERGLFEHTKKQFVSCCTMTRLMDEPRVCSSCSKPLDLLSDRIVTAFDDASRVGRK